MEGGANGVGQFSTQPKKLDKQRVFFETSRYAVGYKVLTFSSIISAVVVKSKIFFSREMPWRSMWIMFG